MHIETLLYNLNYYETVKDKFFEGKYPHPHP